MGEVTLKHRPLLSGVRISSRRPVAGPLPPGQKRMTVAVGGGTLTGVATRIFRDLPQVW